MPSVIDLPRRIGAELQFELAKRSKNALCDATPHFDPDGASIFKRLLDRATSYLEYGAGGSTIEACRLKLPGMTVESDRHFLKTVERTAASLGVSCQRELVHGDVGWTGRWGWPRFVSVRKPSERLGRSYVYAPFHTGTQRYDTVLIDGRYRVACMMAVIEYARKQRQDVTVLFDDYFHRPKYHLVEKYTGKPDRHGRMAVFWVKASDALLPAPTDIREYLRIPD